jgi:hypothetical protein
VRITSQFLTYAVFPQFAFSCTSPNLHAGLGSVQSLANQQPNEHTCASVRQRLPKSNEDGDSPKSGTTPPIQLDKFIGKVTDMAQTMHGQHEQFLHMFDLYDYLRSKNSESMQEAFIKDLQAAYRKSSRAMRAAANARYYRTKKVKATAAAYKQLDKYKV